MYHFLLNLNSGTVISFFGLIIQVGTLVIAGFALNQLALMKKQNKYTADLNKIDALKRFTEIIERWNNLNLVFKNKYNFDLPKIELDNYTLNELVNKNDLDNFKIIIEIFEKDIELNQKFTNLANDLELFSVSLEDEDILNSIKDMVARSFCFMVEGNSVPYLVNRVNNKDGVHNLYKRTIEFRKNFIPYVGSIQEREKIRDEKVRVYNELINKK